MSFRPDIDHVIFDWSGTLYDDHAPSFAATRETVRKFCGKKISYAEYKRHFEIPVDRFYRRYDKRTPIREIDASYFRCFEAHVGRGKPFAGAAETLEFLKRAGIGASVFSTVRQDLLESQCRRLGWEKRFKKIHGSVFDKTRELKNHLRALRVKPSRALFIGDMAHDVEAANADGVLSGCVLSGYHGAEKLLGAGPRFVWAHQKDWHAFFRAVVTPPPRKKAKPRAVATAGALVFNRAREVLLVLTPKWGFTYGIPGGKIDYRETARDAVIRELREETGLKIRPGNLFLLMDCVDSPEFWVPGSHFLLLNYLAATDSTRVTLNEEAVSHLWIKPELAMKLKLNGPTERLVAEYLKRGETKGRRASGY